MTEEIVLDNGTWLVLISGGEVEIIDPDERPRGHYKTQRVLALAMAAQIRENERLRKLMCGMEDRIAAQSALLSRAAEKQ